MIFHHTLSFIRFYTLFILSTGYYSIKGLLLFPFRNRDDVKIECGRAWSAYNLKLCGITLEVHGRKNLEKTPTLFVMNHQSLLDMFIIGMIFPKKTLLVAKHTFRYYPIMNLFLKATGVIFIERFNHVKALKRMKEVRKAIEQGYSMVMAPEGTRTHDGNLRRFKKGAFYLALQTGIQITPITIVNAYQLFPRTKWLPTPGTVKAYIDSPIDTSSLTKETLPDLMERVKQTYLNHLKE